MNEDYLWDKTGNDPEIKKLENSLKAFRQSETEAPKLSITNPVIEVKPVRSESWNRLFSFGMVSFACLAIAIFGIGIFRNLNIEDGEIAKQEAPAKIVETASTKTSEAEISEPKIVTQPTQEVKTVSKSREFAPTKVKFRSKTGQKKYSSKRYKKARRTPSKPKNLELTAEEKHAYEQLMLALSITSSNLKKGAR